MNILQPDYPAWNGSPAYRDKSVVTDEIIHHSAGSLDETPLAIDQQHRNQGWCGIGYHFVITPDGKVYRGRTLDMVPAAAEDDNTNSVDICLIGNFEPGSDGYTGEPTHEQMQSLLDLSVYVHQQLPNIERTIGHRDVSVMKGDPSVSTACPGGNLYAKLPEIKAYVHQHIGH